MFILKKLFELRDKTQLADEKPFLEHLEDLRIVITRVVLTLVIAMGFCFAFRNELMSIIRAPVEQVWQNSQESKMPDKKKTAIVIDLDTWELAKRAERDTSRFSDPQKDHYFSFQDPDGSLNLKFHTDSVIYYRAAVDMEKISGNGSDFIEQLPGTTADMRKQVLALLDEEKRPDAAVDSRGKLVQMQALNPTEGFMLSIKLSLFAGIVLSFPVLLYFILQFILPGLKKNERTALWPALFIGFGLFLTGVFFSYFYVLPKVLDFFYNYSQEMGVSNEWRIGYYISFATQFTLIFGLSFELPVVVMTLVKLGILNYNIMRNTRSYAILAIVIIAALITPTPDAFTLLLLAGPMIVLYEICIWLAFFHNRKEREAELAEQKEIERKMIAAPAFTASRDDDDEDPDGDNDGSDNDGPDGGSPHVDREDYFKDSAEYDFHDDDHDHYHYSETEPYEHDGEINKDDDSEDGNSEGEEHDDGTHDFSEEELEQDYSHDYRPDDDCEPPEKEEDYPVDDGVSEDDSDSDSESESDSDSDSENTKDPKNPE